MSILTRFFFRLFFVVSVYLRLGSDCKIVSIEDLNTELPNLLEIPNTHSIHTFIKKHGSFMFPTYSCSSIQDCFGEEISELKTALLESSGESDNVQDAANVEGIRASSFNRLLKSAVGAISSKIGRFTGKKTAKHMVRAIDYFLNAFFLVRARITEFRKSQEERVAVLSMMQVLFQHAFDIARQSKKERKIPDRFEWLYPIREYRSYKHMNRHWWSLYLLKHPHHTLYTVPIPLLGPTFLTLWALGKNGGTFLAAFEQLNKSDFKTKTIEYWAGYPKKAAKCSAKATSDADPSTCIDQLKDELGVLTADKAKYLVEEFAKTPLRKLEKMATDLVEWIKGGADQNDAENPFKRDYA